jgi:hypothetical protein
LNILNDNFSHNSWLINKYLSENFIWISLTGFTLQFFNCFLEVIGQIHKRNPMFFWGLLFIEKVSKIYFNLLMIIVVIIFKLLNFDVFPLFFLMLFLLIFYFFYLISVFAILEINLSNIFCDNCFWILLNSY